MEVHRLLKLCLIPFQNYSHRANETIFKLFETTFQNGMYIFASRANTIFFTFFN